MCTSYDKQVYHGEPFDYTIPNTYRSNNFDYENSADIDENNDDGLFVMLDDLQHGIDTDDTPLGVDDVVDEIASMVEKLEEKLYPECEKFLTLEFIVKLLHVKVYNRWSNKSFEGISRGK